MDVKYIELCCPHVVQPNGRARTLARNERRASPCLSHNSPECLPTCSCLSLILTPTAPSRKSGANSILVSWVCRRMWVCLMTLRAEAGIVIIPILVSESAQRGSCLASCRLLLA